MDPDIQNKIATLEDKIDSIYQSVEKTRKYFLWTIIITVVVLVLPLIAMVFVIPAFINSYTSALDGLL
jgi:type II secretory pathway component PulF